MKKYIKKIVLVISMVCVSFSLTACGDVDLGSVIGEMIKIIDVDSNTQSDVSNIIRVKWGEYQETLANLSSAGLITSSASKDTLNKAWEESKKKAENAFVTNTSGKVDEEIANHLKWFRTMHSISKIYNQLSLNYCVAMLKNSEYGDIDDKSSNIASIDSKYSPVEDISNRLVKIRVLADLKIKDKDNHSCDAFNKKEEWIEVMKTTDVSDTVEGTDSAPPIELDPSKYASLDVNYQDSRYYVYKSEHKEEGHREPIYGGEPPQIIGYHEWTDRQRWYWVYKRGDCKVGTKPAVAGGGEITENDIRSAVVKTNLNITPIFTDKDIPQAVKKSDSNSGYRTLRGDGTNTGSNDIDINVDKYAFDIDLSQPDLIVKASDLMAKYETETNDKRSVGTEIIKTNQFKYDSSGKSDEIYITTDYVGYEERLQEEYIIKELSKFNGTVNANKGGKDLVITVGGVPIMGIRLNEISDEVKRIIGEGVLEEMDDGYMAIDYTRFNIEDGDAGLPRRGLIPTRMYVSYISEIDANGFFNIETSEAQYSLKDKSFVQNGSGITEADGKDLGDKYDLQRSFHIIKNDENKDTLLCLQYFGLFRNDKVVADQWFPIGRSFVLDRQIVKPSEKRIKDLTSRIGWWENANGEWDKSSANGLYLSDLCDIDSYGSDNAIYVLEKGDLDSTESLLGKKNKTVLLKSSSWSKEESNGKIWFKYKGDPAGENYLYNDWFETCFDSNSSWNGVWKFDSQGYWDGTANKDSADNVVKVTTNGGWYVGQGGKYYYGAGTGGWVCAVSGTYKFEGDGKTYTLGADGYAEGEGTGTGGSGTNGSTEQMIETALNTTNNFYTNNVYTYWANSLTQTNRYNNAYNVINSYEAREKAWNGTLLSSPNNKARGELGQIKDASKTAIDLRNSNLANGSGGTARIFNVNNATGQPITYYMNNATRDGYNSSYELWSPAGVRGMYNYPASGQRTGDDCSSFVGLYVNELIKQVTGNYNWINIDQFSSQALADKTGAWGSMTTYFDWYSGSDLGSLTIKKGDILVQKKNVAGTEGTGHVEVYYDSNRSCGWGFVSSTLPKSNVISKNGNKYTDAKHDNYSVLIRFKGKVN